MLSYRHAFHAGNHADVLKHLTLCLILRHLTAKDKPCFILDTHAAGGIFALAGRSAALHQEYLSGIARVYGSAELKELVPEYFSAIDSLNQGVKPLADKLPAYYPGSPYFEAALTRECDRMTMVEMHRSEFESLQENFRRDRRITLHCQDAFLSLNSLLPPPIKRGLVFMDPSYEVKSDYIAVLKALKQGLPRFNTGIFALWYPVLARLQDRSRSLVQDIKRLGHPLLQAELRVTAQGEEHGMCGSGLLVINYPYQLYEDLAAVIDVIYPLLADADGAAKLKILNPQP